MRTKSVFIAIVLVTMFITHPLTDRAIAQELDVHYVPTPHNVVAAMLDVTNVGPGDYVIDLGSGDGRIVIAAAERGAVGYGIDLDPVRVEEAEQNAHKADVSDRVVFVEGNLFDADISRATVVTMYLLSSINLRLKPILLEKLRPGTRIASHSFSMGEWEADEHLNIDGRSVYYWVIPANVRGSWEWKAHGKSFTMTAEQKFQKITLKLGSGDSSLSVRDPLLNGERISFTAHDRQNGDQYLFSGRVDGNSITGLTHIRSGNSRSVETWTATLKKR